MSVFGPDVYVHNDSLSECIYLIDATDSE